VAKEYLAGVYHDGSGPEIRSGGGATVAGEQLFRIAFNDVKPPRHSDSLTAHTFSLSVKQRWSFDFAINILVHTPIQTKP